jgi:hypothetical protein
VTLKAKYLNLCPKNLTLKCVLVRSSLDRIIVTMITTIFVMVMVMMMMTRIISKIFKKGKAFPLPAWGFQEAEAPEFLENQHRKVVRLSALLTGRLYPQEGFLVPISVRG